MNTAAQSVPPVVKVLLIVNGVLFVAAQYFGWHEVLTQHFALWPATGPDAVRIGNRVMLIPPFQVWQLVSYGFLHDGLAHLFFNMFALWMFGRPIERLFGSGRFAIYYFVCVVGAGLVQLLAVSLQSQLAGPTIGASGGMFGILLAFGMMYPNQRLVLLFPPIPIKAKWFVILYGALELYFGVTGTVQGVAHFAHLGGMLFGLVLILMWSIRVPGR